MEDTITRLYNATEEAEERYVMTIFVDIQNAFNSLWWLALMAELKQRDCPRNMYLIIKDYLINRVVMMEDSYLIVERQAKRECPQGPVLALKFWNLILEGLLRQLEELLNTQPIAYANDLVILIPGNSRRAVEERGAAAMAFLESCASKNKLTVSERKTVGMLLQGELHHH
jgi:Reverse transcriptase (RNA-dependent DNA polymerase).